MNKVKVLLGGLVLAAGLLVGVGALLPLTADAQDCSANAVIKCGVGSVDDIRSKFDADASTRNIFAAYGLTSDVIHNATSKSGETTINGDVIVDGQVVATGAHSAGRQYISGSTQKNSNGTTYYDSPNQTAFRSNSISVIAFFDGNGQFIGAVMYDCGNPVAGTAKPVPPKPTYACNSLTATMVNRTTFNFMTDASAANGATIKDYTYSFGDGNSATAGATATHTYAKAGTYEVSVVVRVDVNGQTVNAAGNCKATVTVTPEMCPIPGKENYPKDSPECKEDKYIKVCNTRTNAIETIKEQDFDASYMTKDLTKCEKIQVCDLTTHQTVTIYRSEMSDKYTTDFSKCQKITVCDTTTSKIISIYPSEMKDTYTTDLSKCAVAPPELPHTGPTDLLSGAIGVASLVGVTLAYIASRRAV